MHQQKGKKILIYFFLLISVGSVNNINLNNLKFNEITNINVVGLEEKDNFILLNKIKNLNLDNIFFLKKEEIKNKIDSNSLVEKYIIFKRYPNSLDIKVKKTELLARLNREGKIFFIGSNGKLLESNFSNVQIPFVFGNPEVNEFLNFKKIIDESKFSYDEIKNLYFFSSKRWDIELKSNILIKLPRSYSSNSLKIIYEFLYNNNFKDVKILDARVENQIILND
jgi:cell division protein FtsQ